MLLTQVYLLLIYILFIELAMVTVVAIALFVALVVTMRKLDNKKTHLCLVVRDVFLVLKSYSATRHTLVVAYLSIIIILIIKTKVNIFLLLISQVAMLYLTIFSCKLHNSVLK